MLWKQAIATLFAMFGLTTGALSQTPHNGLLPDLEGKWRVVKVEGEQPLFLNAAKASDLIGRELTIERFHIKLWDGFSGDVKTSDSYVSSLNAVLQKPEKSNDEIASLGEKSRKFYHLTLSQCTISNKVTSSCPVLYFTKDEQGVSLVSYPFGLVRLSRIDH